MLDIPSKFLEMKGFRVHTAQDASEALRTLSAVRCDVVISDVRMPGSTASSFSVNSKRRTVPFPLGPLR